MVFMYAQCTVGKHKYVFLLIGYLKLTCTIINNFLTVTNYFSLACTVKIGK